MLLNKVKLAKNIFSLFVSRNNRNSSRFWLGGVNLQYIKEGKKENINWHKVIRKTWWTLRLDKVLINGKDSGLCKLGSNETRHRCAVIMDSGTSAMAAPSQTFKEFWEMLFKSGGDIGS